MDKGNEGDGIVFIAFRQTIPDCIIPLTINAVGQITVELLYELIVKSLQVISNSESPFPLTLPPNIASRHRICTDIAAKIKEMGYLGDCGYNQLLYPVESQTRSLLTWIVEKLPRIEEAAEEFLGPNAILNRKISNSLSEWKQQSWRLPNCCKGIPQRSIYSTNQFQTIPRLLGKDRMKSSQIFKTASNAGYSASSSIIERHTLELVNDSMYAKRLEDDFEIGDETDELVGNNGINGNSNKKDTKLGLENYSVAMKSNIKNALKQALQKSTALKQGMISSNEAYDIQSSFSSNKSKNLQELIQNITDDFGTSSSSTKGDRGTRFSHATEFSQEQSSSASITKSFSDANSSSSTSGINSNNKSGLTSGGNDSDRKAQEEQEDISRQKELDSIKSLILASTAQADSYVKNQSIITSKSRHLESELARFLAEAEILENEILIKKATLKMLPEASDNIVQLQNICSAGSARLMQLAQEWEKHRRPLLEKYREIRANKNKRRARCRELVDDMKKLREEMIGMIQDLKDKQDRSVILQEEMSKLPKNINRALYTHRIMDITSQIVKQNKDIDKITADIREVQKTINSNTSILQRADAIAEELIFS
eukprot:gene6336-8723_t